MKLVVLGAPGAGKGTQADLLSDHYGVPHISTGDILRSHVAQKTEIGLDITLQMQNGSLVSDEVAIDILASRIAYSDCEHGFILDGFPRTLLQAEKLNSIVGVINKVIYIHVPDEVIINRMGGRKICTGCGASYHIEFKPPISADVCDHCGKNLTQRDDDNITTVTKRLVVYHQNTNPILNFFKDLNLCLEVDGVGNVNDIAARVVRLLGE